MNSDISWCSEEGNILLGESGVSWMDDIWPQVVIEQMAMGPYTKGVETFYIEQNKHAWK